jgi:hypothetical protein
VVDQCAPGRVQNRFGYLLALVFGDEPGEK